MAPVLNGDREPRERRRPDSASTGQHSEKTERFELEESSEFLQSVDGEMNIKICFENYDTSKYIIVYYTQPSIMFLVCCENYDTTLLCIITQSLVIMLEL